MPDLYRLFIATELPAPVKQVLINLQEQLRRERLPVRWEKPEMLHLTLHFLGETEAGRLPEIGAKLREVLVAIPVHELRLGAPGAFPNLSRPDFIWVGVEGEVAELKRLQEALVTALEPLGFRREARSYHAHLTIGRMRREATDPQREQFGKCLAQLPALPDASWRVERVVLFQSERLDSGARYVERDAVRLGPAGP